VIKPVCVVGERCNGRRKPHPSGLNIFWNDRGAVSRLKVKVTELLEK